MRGALRIISPATRNAIVREIMALPDRFEVILRSPTRTVPQNSRLWAMLSDVSRAEPDGRKHSPDTWKALFMHALQYEIRFEMGLNGEPFPVGFRSSRMSKDQMAELITFIAEYGDRHGVQWSEPHPDQRQRA